MNNVTVRGRTSIGPDNLFFPNAVVGTIPQDLKYKGADTKLEIGQGNTFRENTTVHLGTEAGDGITVIGSHNHLMAGVHVAHDARLEDSIIVANNVLLAGHVHIESHAVVGGGAAMHHFTTIGRHSFVGGLTRVVHDVPPYMKFSGDPGRVRGFNSENLIRWNFDEDRIAAIRVAYKSLFANRSGMTIAEALRHVESNGMLTPDVQNLLDFIKRSQQSPHGRYRESLRSDTRQDLGDFYNKKSSEESDS
jgi:UDP-N-acetylglucosamine acyltransferase